MEEILISFQTAKLAKEKGFRLYTVNSYCFFQNTREYELVSFKENKCIPAPTQTQLQTWLREVHNIYLTIVTVGDSGYELRYWYYSILGVDCKDGQHGINRFQTYEEALEAGLLKALKLVK